jgi:hypothetical protein
MSVGTVANKLGKARNEVNKYKDENVAVIAQDLALSVQEARLIGDLGTPLAVPGAPTSPVGTIVSPTKVSVAFVAPVSDGGDPITSYTVTSTPGGFSKSGTTSPIVVTGAFVTATGYTFKVVAANSVGTGAASAASGSVTPNP